MVTIALGVTFFSLMIAGGYFSGATLTSWLIWAVAPAALFFIAMIAINFWEITEWIERRSRR